VITAANAQPTNNSWRTNNNDCKQTKQIEDQIVKGGQNVVNEILKRTHGTFWNP
jgi:hypothetical protein